MAQSFRLLHAQIIDYIIFLNKLGFFFLFLLLKLLDLKLNKSDEILKILIIYAGGVVAEKETRVEKLKR